MIDLIFEGVNFTKVIFIISPKYEEIAGQISASINRGSTGLFSKGMYTDQENLRYYVWARGQKLMRCKA